MNDRRSHVSSQVAAAHTLYAEIVGVTPASEEKKLFYCEWCKRQVGESGHETSIEHALSRGLSNAPHRRVVIPDGNVGSRILAKLGWRDDGQRPGLGKVGREGRICPVEVSFKNDTSGLGARTYQARVTHHPPKKRPPEDAQEQPKVHYTRRRLFSSSDYPEGYLEEEDNEEFFSKVVSSRKRRRRSS